MLPFAVAPSSGLVSIEDHVVFREEECFGGGLVDIDVMSAVAGGRADDVDATSAIVQDERRRREENRG